VVLAVINKLMPGRYPALCSVEFGLSSTRLGRAAIAQLDRCNNVNLLTFFCKKIFFSWEQYNHRCRILSFNEKQF